MSVPPKPVSISFVVAQAFLSFVVAQAFLPVRFAKVLILNSQILFPSASLVSSRSNVAATMQC
ncbi:MAG: hypothetical protein EAZ92_16420 [Candidatus Kapaibacterium sp.]|nr:MAG: hypothetical protein EAZ92_16420 [Candidatus Kapabacteria bacterium]